MAVVNVHIDFGLQENKIWPHYKWHGGDFWWEESKVHLGTRRYNFNDTYSIWPIKTCIRQNVFSRGTNSEICPWPRWIKMDWLTCSSSLNTHTQPRCTLTDIRDRLESVCRGATKVAQSCLTLCDPMDCSLPGSSVHGIFQARVLEWVAISFSRGSSWPRDQSWFQKWNRREGGRAQPLEGLHSPRT